jgi:hypothetical protein
VALLISLVLLSYPYSAGLGGWRTIFWFGPILAIVALLGVWKKRTTSQR